MYMSVLPTRVCLVPSEIERSDLQLEFETVVNLHGSTGNTHTHVICKHWVCITAKPSFHVSDLFPVPQFPF